MKRFILTAFALSFAFHVEAGNIPKDPYGSPMWEYLAEQTFGDATIVVDKRLQIHAPKNAESNFQVPVSVDASALGTVEEIVIMTDLNPFPIAARFFPMKAKPFVATRVKLNEASVIHAVAKTVDGVWHMNGTFVLAEGGGCAAAPQQMASEDWADHLLEAKGKIWQRANDQRMRLTLRHPMDTGLSGDVPVFYVEEINILDENAETISRFEPLEPISENPVLTLEFSNRSAATLRAMGRDNNANEFDVTLKVQ